MGIILEIMSTASESGGDLQDNAGWEQCMYMRVERHPSQKFQSAPQIRPFITTLWPFIPRPCRQILSQSWHLLCAPDQRPNLPEQSIHVTTKPLNREMLLKRSLRVLPQPPHQLGVAHQRSQGVGQRLGILSRYHQAVL